MQDQPKLLRLGILPHSEDDEAFCFIDERPTPVPILALGSMPLNEGFSVHASSHGVSGTSSPTTLSTVVVDRPARRLLPSVEERRV
jgi:hypothetical protein